MKLRVPIPSSQYDVARLRCPQFVFTCEKKTTAVQKMMKKCFRCFLRQALKERSTSCVSLELKILTCQTHGGRSRRPFYLRTKCKTLISVLDTEPGERCDAFIATRRRDKGKTAYFGHFLLQRRAPRIARGSRRPRQPALCLILTQVQQCRVGAR